jgi:biopolymer transport protein ExbB
MLNILIKGGPVMIFIGLCALAATAIIIERFLFFRSIKKEDKTLVPALKDLLFTKKFDEAKTICDAASSPLAKLIQTALASFRQAEASPQESVRFAASREIPRIERYIAALGTIASVSTLLGLLGTVFGNIEAFGILAESNSMGNPALLAGAIAEALITTAAGLIVSIPATIFHNYLVSQANYLIAETETSIGELLLLMAGKSENNAELSNASSAGINPIC